MMLLATWVLPLVTGSVEAAKVPNASRPITATAIPAITPIPMRTQVPATDVPPVLGRSLSTLARTANFVGLRVPSAHGPACPEVSHAGWSPRQSSQGIGCLGRGPTAPLRSRVVVQVDVGIGPRRRVRPSGAQPTRDRSGAVGPRT